MLLSCRNLIENIIITFAYSGYQKEKKSSKIIRSKLVYSILRQKYMPQLLSFTSNSWHWTTDKLKIKIVYGREEF